MVIRFSGIAVLVATSICLAGCTTSGQGSVATGGRFTAPTQIKTPVAVQALGVNAVPVNVEFGQQIKVPAIYRISKEGEFSEICSKDFKLQTALTAIVVEEKTSTDVIYDKLAGGVATLNVFGLGTLNFPYAKTKVDGFKVRTALTPTADNIVDYIIKNLGPNCPTTVLSTAPYYVVTQVATAERAFTVSKDAVGAKIPLWGLGSLDYANDENIDGPRTSVTFGVNGRWIRPGDKLPE